MHIYKRSNPNILGFIVLFLAILAFLALPLVGQAQSPDFVSVFGDRPSGPRDRAMVQAQMIYDARASRFDSIVDLDSDFPIEAQLLYQEVGMGLPVKWHAKNGDEFVAFPNAVYTKFHFVPVSLAKLFPGKVWRDFHLASIQDGFCVVTVNANFPGFILEKNDANCAALGAE